MGSNLSAFLNVLAQPPGDLIYHLVVSFALILTGGFALATLVQTSWQSQARRTLIGCSILLFLQLLLLLFRSLNLNAQFTIAYVFPLVERLASTLTITWLIWTFFEDQQPYIPNPLTLVLSVVLIILAVLSIAGISWISQLSTADFHLVDLLWQSIALALSLIGLGLAIFNFPPQRLVIILVFLLLACGHLLQILLQDTLGLTMGAVRIAQTLSLPWLVLLIQRFHSTGDQSRSSEIEITSNLSETPVDTRPALINQLLKINLTQTGQEKFQAVSHALSLSVVADVCYLVKIPAGIDKLDILSGYDLIRETCLHPDSLVREDLPHIMGAWEAGQTLELTRDFSEVRDALTLGLLLKYHNVGNIFAFPLGLPDKPLAGGVIFLSPYTSKSWGDHTKRLMEQIKDPLAQVLFTLDETQEIRQALTNAHQQISTLTEEAQELHATMLDKQAQIQAKETLIKELKAKYQIDKMQTIKTIDQMKRRIMELTGQVEQYQNAADRLEQLQAEIRQLSNERDKLNLALSRANATVRDLQTQTGQTGPIRLSLDSQIISLDSIAANAKLRIASRLQQNNIDLEIHNPDGRQVIKTDPELLQTSLVELLKNAIQASEPGGSILLDQRLSLEMGMMIIQVTDYGEGLTQAEQTALYSARHDAIPGIGDVNAVRNAIRAIRVLNGKIWLKSKKASYTTFRFQIPVRIID